MTSDTGGVTYGWDAANRLSSITTVAGTTLNKTEFYYDGLGRRVGEKLNGKLIRVWVWDGLEVCEEHNSANTVTKRYLPQGMQVVGSGSYCYTRDHLGSVREMTDAKGNVRARYDYDPYGTRSANLAVKIGSGSTALNPVNADFGFTGHYFHAASGLYLAPYRAYNPSLGRWLSRDPLGESGGLNLYGYVGNNPTNLTDPTGLWAYFQPSTWFDGKGYQPGIVEDEIGQSAQAVIDGLIPFADPFGDNGGYNKCDKYNQMSYRFGEGAQMALASAAYIEARVALASRGLFSVGANIAGRNAAYEAGVRGASARYYSEMIARNTLANGTRTTGKTLVDFLTTIGSKSGRSEAAVNWITGKLTHFIP